jgi:hypothetical protein
METKNKRNVILDEFAICLNCTCFTHQREENGNISSICKDSNSLKNYFEKCSNWRKVAAKYD